MKHMARLSIVLALTAALIVVLAPTATAAGGPSTQQVEPPPGGPPGPPPPCDESRLGHWYPSASGYWLQCVRGAYGYEWVNTGQRWDGGCGADGNTSTARLE